MKKIFIAFAFFSFTVYAQNNLILTRTPYVVFQNIEVNNESLPTKDTITVYVYSVHKPKAENEFNVFLEDFGNGLRFENGTLDELKFWLYIAQVVNDVLGPGSDYEEASETLIDNANYWLKDLYGDLLYGGTK